MSCSTVLIGLVACVALINAQSISLGAAGTYGVLAGADITNTGITTVYGSLGIYPGTSITGFPPGCFTGVESEGNLAGLAAQNAASAAYDQATSLPCGTDLTGQDLGGMVLTPGVYCFDTSATLTGVLTIDGEGQSSPLFIFQIGTTFTTATGSEITLIDDAQSCGVFWAVGSSATLGTGSALVGNILASASISANTDVSINGGLYALSGGVTIIMGEISAIGSCGSVSGTTTTSTTSSTTSTTTTTSSTTTSTTTTSTTSTSPTSTSTTTTSSSKTTSTITTHSNACATTSTTMSQCISDNCLRAFRATQTPGRLQTAQSYCSLYTETTSYSSTPTWVPAECTPSRISSVCSCISTSTSPGTGTTTSTTGVCQATTVML